MQKHTGKKQTKIFEPKSKMSFNQMNVDVKMKATKFCSIMITGFCYPYFTVRVAMNDSSVRRLH